MSRIHDTRHYHRHGRIDLMTEFTISQSLCSADSPYSKALGLPSSFGETVARRLVEMKLIQPGCRVCEVGGGYGSLMRGLLETCSSLVGQVLMIDLSVNLLKRQRACLKPWGSKSAFVHGDISELMPSLRGFDLMILNEVVGDLDTWTGLSAGKLPGEVARFIRDYGLDIPGRDEFHFNIGALRLVEAICRKGIPAFISEHSCDPIIPPGMDYLARGLSLDGFPREIKLKDHSEYTIRFSHLVRVAETLGKKTRTGSLIEFLGVKETPGLRFIFTAQASARDEQALILEFLDHVREYRWLTIE